MLIDLQKVFVRAKNIIYDAYGLAFLLKKPQQVIL